MCGITGYLDSKRQTSEDKMQCLIKCMNDTIAHRGPDDRGYWTDAGDGIALGHQRLSIIDLSPEGHQPMISGSGRYVIVFNGEIYNFLELRRELEGKFKFRGRSDTEVMLAAVEEWGIEKAVKKFTGMFAFAIWDRQEKLLHLGRDRLGEKPLYYGWNGNLFFFSSELKAMRAHPDFKAEIDRDALALFLRHNYVPAPYSIYRGINKLLPGSMLTVYTMSARIAGPIYYWSAKKVAEEGCNNRYRGTEQEAVNELDNLLRGAIREQMIADVPLGAFLSGGIDSTTVVALMQAQSERPVKTFTIGFHEEEYNEAKHAKEVARYLGTEHTELYVTPEQARDVIPKLPTLYDEPFSDSSQIPTYLVSCLARKHVTVSLSGDGGDELFGGYNRYFWGRDFWRKFSLAPCSLRSLGAKLIQGVTPQQWDKLFKTLSPVLPKKFRQKQPGDKLHKLAKILDIKSPEEMYLGLVSHWDEPSVLVKKSAEPPTPLTDCGKWANIDDFTQRMMYLDMITYLPDDILVKVDRASMGVSLESRVPFLNHNVVEFAWKLPLSFKIRNNEGKWILRQVLYKYVPRELMERPKMGFGIPIGNWLRGPLREWAEDLLDEKSLNREGFFETEYVKQKWREHLEGKRNWQYHLWDILMFQSWLKSNSIS